MSKEAALTMLSGTPGITSGGGTIPDAATNTGTGQGTTAPPKEMESTTFAKYAAKEAALVKEREALKAERAKVDEITGKVRAFEEKRKVDPIAALKDIGFTDTEIFNFYAAQDKPEPTAEDIARKTTQEELKKYQDQQLTEQQKVQVERDKQVIDGYKKGINVVIQTNKEKFKASNLFGPVAEEMAFMMAEEAVKDGQDAPSALEAAEIVEEYYKWQYEDLKAIYEPKVVEGKVEPVLNPVKTRTPVPQPQAEAPKQKTITNRITTTTASTIPKQETRAEKRERLMRQLAGG